MRFHIILLKYAKPSSKNCYLDGTFPNVQAADSNAVMHHSNLELKTSQMVPLLFNLKDVFQKDFQISIHLTTKQFSIFPN